MLLPIPEHADDDAPFELHVQPPAGEAFACACTPTAQGPWRGTLRELRAGPACAFGAIAVRTLARADTRITIAELAPRPAAHAEALDAHVHTCADAVSAWFGRFPVEHLLLLVLPSRGPAIAGGSARGLGGARIALDVPPRLRAGQFAQDWVLIHEMVHLALASLPPAHHWLEEGSATYVEPLIQAMAGRVTPEQVFAAMLAEYAQGLAGPERGGLDDDASWGRTYYGGALFCLLADVRIRERTQNARSLRDALRGVLTAGLDLRTTATLDDVLAIADAATGTTVLRELYDAMGRRPHAIDLDALWRDLGLRLDGERVGFDEQAKFAAIRRALVPTAAR